jgi:hypothetical protein
MNLRTLILLACTLLTVSACIVVPGRGDDYRGDGYRGDGYRGDHYRGDDERHDYGRGVWRD